MHQFLVFIISSYSFLKKNKVDMHLHHTCGRNYQINIDTLRVQITIFSKSASLQHEKSVFFLLRPT